MDEIKFCSDDLVLSIDAMGGDNAPAIVIEGLNIFVEQIEAEPIKTDQNLWPVDVAGGEAVSIGVSATSEQIQSALLESKRSAFCVPNIHFFVYGDEKTVVPLLQKYPKLKNRVTFHHTDIMITADTKPSVAVRTGRLSSMGLAIQAVKEGTAAGVISAGNTGAYMALSLLELRPISGIQRPAICSKIPTLKSQAVILDLGATIDCDAQNLLQFAIMGELYAQEVLGLDNPSIGLLNIGSEDTKGNTVVKEAAALLKETAPGVKNFYGFIEGDDITKGTTDVVVTDGFSGNIALKAIEGTAKMIIAFLKESFQYSWLTKLAFILAQSSLEKLLKKRLDPRYHNGAMFLGINGVVIKSHGGTDGLGFSNALSVAVKIITNGLNEKIKAALLQRSQ